MAHLTQRALAAALLDQLREKPLEKITVTDLTNACGLTRNTFYYHFRDIYDLLSYIFISELATIRDQYDNKQNWEGGLEMAVSYLYSHKQAVKNVYESLSKDFIVRYINEVAYDHTMAVVKIRSRGELDPAVCDILAKFYRDALLGNLTDWLVNGMKTPPEILAEDFDIMFTGTFASAAKAAMRIVGRGER